MNILIDTLPTAVEIDGHEYRIDTDYRAAIRTILAYEDNDLTATEKTAILLENLYLDVPDNIEQAFLLGIKFLNGGEPVESDPEAEAPQRLYSFSKDANLIFAAFQQTHGIDLANTEYLHWWHFLALFMDLGGETAFCNLISLRKRVKSGKASKEERRAAHEMGDMFDVPKIDTRTMEEREKEAEFMRLFYGNEQQAPPDTEYQGVL